MNIDCSISNTHYAFLYSNLIFGSRHIGLAFTKQVDIPAVERIKHFVLGIFEWIPFVGHLISAIDRKVSHIRVLVLNQKTPYERGYAHGKLCRKEIQSLYKIVKQKIESMMEMGFPDQSFIGAQEKIKGRFEKFRKTNGGMTAKTHLKVN